MSVVAVILPVTLIPELNVPPVDADTASPTANTSYTITSMKSFSASEARLPIVFAVDVL